MSEWILGWKAGKKAAIAAVDSEWLETPFDQQDKFDKAYTNGLVNARDAVALMPIPEPPKETA